MRSPPHRSLCLAPLALVALSLPASAAPVPAQPQDVAALRAALDEIVQRTSLARSRASVLVQSLDDGKVIYAHDPDELLNPASNVKLFTAAAALAKLGSDYRWTTDFLLDAPIKPNGEVKNLYVRGNGDPLLTTETLYALAGELFHRGIRQVRGNLVIDDSAFDGDRIGPGFDQEETDRAYMAPTGAISLNWNSIEIDVYPGAAVGSKARVEVEPASDYFKLDNRAVTVRPRARGRILSKVAASGDRELVQIAGRVPKDRGGAQLWRKVDRPDLYFGDTLKGLLALRGIKVKGKVVGGVVPEGASLLYGYDGDTLDLAVRKMDKTSSNFIAEQLVKTLGAESKGVPGSWAKGVDVVEDFLEEQVGIPRGSYVMKNGSGLNDTNRFSASQVVKLLTFMSKRFRLAPEYLASLGVAGKDGTLRTRMEGTDAAGRLRGKTGTLETVSALSGLVESVGGERFAFSVLVNDFPGRHAAVIQAIDDLGVALASAGGAEGPQQAAGKLMAEGQPQTSPLGELKARAATYIGLGMLHDKHNLPFLRTAYRSERDPALKAVVAEALYRSDPADSSGVRAVLDAWSTAPEVFGRLMAAAHELGVPAPVVSSLLDIAAEGNAEALARTLDLAPLASGDPALQQELMDGLDQIARTAPDELLAAFKAAPAESLHAGVELLARGAAASSEPDNPFPTTLKGAEATQDTDKAAFAKSLMQEYVTKLALAKATQRLKEAAEGAATVGTKPLPAKAISPTLVTDVTKRRPPSQSVSPGTPLQAPTAGGFEPGIRPDRATSNAAAPKPGG